MAFLDYAKLNVKAGKGGDGVVRWRRERAIAMGGPAGGDGGRGGDVYVKAEVNLHTLHNYANRTDFEAKDGQSGGGKNMHGANGEDLVMTFPVGTELYIQEYDKTIDLTFDGQTELLFRGGGGGRGNTHFKSSTDQAPEKFTEGKIGEFGTVVVNLKMIANAGFIGYPNAGKSSLLNALTNSQSKVANYNFTTLEPHLGDFHGYILADIPGLIEGASDGKGLGIKFLKHIERTNFLVHLVEATNENLSESYEAIRNELGKFNAELLNKKEIIVVSKIDNVKEEEKKELGKKISKLAKVAKCEVENIIKLSLFDDNSVSEFKKVLIDNLQNSK
jgi:GTP-binding protein